MEIYTYPLRLRLYQKFFTERVHGNFHVSCNIETNIIQKCFYLKGPWTFPCTLKLLPCNCNPVTDTEILHRKVHKNFHVPSSIETNWKMLLLKGSMEISMYPVILRLIQKFFTKRVHGNFHVPCNIETNSEILYWKGPWKFPCMLSHWN